MSVYKSGISLSANQDAAQAFLSDKLSKNKYNSSNDYSTEGFDPSSYTSDQLSSLNASGGAKKFGKKTYSVVSNQDEIDAATSANSSGGDTRGFDADSDSGRNYASGAWGSGDLDAAGLAAKYNLDTSQEGRGDGHIWGRNADGSEVYIGKSSMDLASNEGLISNHSKQAGDEVDHSGVPESLSSLGDIKGAILTEWKGGEGQKVPEAVMKDEEVVHSPEIQQAKARVGKYENDILSGKTSQDIYGGANAFNAGYQLNLQGTTNPMGNSGNYQFDADIPSFNGSDISAEAKEPAPVQAASSFLANQKKKAIKDFNIKPTN